MSNHPFQRYAEGFWAIWLLHIGRELHLLDRLRQQRLGSAELAEQLQLEPSYTSVWCRCARAFELLDGDEEQGYALHPDWHETLDWQGAWASTYVGLSRRVHESIAAVFRGRALPEPAISLRLLVQEGLTSSYRWLFEEFPKQVAEFEERLQNPGRLLEYGCGIGCGLRLLRQSHPEWELTGLEADYECAREAEKATKAVIAVSRAEDSRYEERFDLALFHRSLAQCQQPSVAIERAARSLRAGGLLVVSSQAEFPDFDRLQAGDRGNLGERFFYQMFLAPDGIRPLAFCDVSEWAQAAGLEVVAEHTHPTIGVPTMIFRKP